MRLSERTRRVRPASVAEPVHPPAEAAANCLLHAARSIVLVVLAATPWAFGGVTREFQSYLFLAVLAAFGLWMGAVCVRLGQRAEARIRFPLMLLPLTAGIVWGTVQVVRLNEPGSGPLPADALQRLATLSFYPASTRLEVAGLVLATMAFALGAWLFQSRRAQLWLWGVLAVNGAALSFFGIAQKLSWNGRLFWTIEVAGGQPFASFVNRNNAAGFLNLCLAGALGLMIWAFADSSRQNVRPLRQRGSEFKTGLRRLARRVLAACGPLTTWQIVAGTIVTLIIAGVLCTLSRGGILAMTLAGLITAGAFARRRTRRLPILAAVGAALILSVCLLGWLGLKDSVAGRLATLYGQSAQADARLGNWRDAWGAVRDFGLLGSGLGTYRYIYLPYERQESTVWFYHAENQYLQTLVEAGAVGLTCLAAALALMLLAIGGLLGSRELQSAEGVAFVGLFAFASQALHALTDFGLFLPANFLAFALVCGAVVGRAGLLEVRGAFVNLPAWRFLTPRVVGLLALAGILSNGVAGYREIAAAASVEAAAHRLPQLTRPDAYTASALQEQIQQLQAALPARPDDATLHRALAQLWIYRYRHQTYIQLRSQTPEASAADQLWRATDLLPLHREINRLWQADDRQHLLALLSEPAVCENLVPAVRHLRAAQACCPLLTNLDLPLAALAFVDNPQEPTGAAHLRHAVLIAPSDPDVLFQAGLLASQAKLEELAWNCWRRSLQLSPRHLGDVLAQVNGQITIPQLLDQLLPDTPELLIGLARGAVRIQVGEEERASLLARAKRQLAAQKGKLPEDRWQYASAGLLRLENQPAAAADAYRRALRLKPDALEWRVELAEFWEEQGRLEEALSEARRCAWAAPDRADIQQLLARLHRTQLQRPQPLR